MLTRTANEAGEWITVQGEETAFLDLRLDPSSAARLARAIDSTTGSAMDAH